MNNFERLLPYLREVIREGQLNHEAIRDLQAFRREPAYEQLPRTSNEAISSGNHALFLLRLAADTLTFISSGDLPAALARVRDAEELPLTPEPFGGMLDLLGMHLGERVGDQDSRMMFAWRSGQYRDRFARSEAMRGLDSFIADPYVSSVLEGSLVESAPAGEPEAAHVAWIPSPSTSAPETGFYPFSTTEQTNTRTYFVLVRKLTDPEVAAFAIFNATLADITDGGDYGLRDERGELYADLLLDFNEDALGLLASLDPARLMLRFVFQHSEVYETFSVEDGSLFDIEASLEEKRLYFKLRVPHAWEAAQVPLDGVWSNLECCVVLSEGA